MEHRVREERWARLRERWARLRERWARPMEHRVREERAVPRRVALPRRQHRAHASVLPRPARAARAEALARSLNRCDRGAHLQRAPRLVREEGRDVSG